MSNNLSPVIVHLAVIVLLTALAACIPIPEKPVWKKMLSLLPRIPLQAAWAGGLCGLAPLGFLTGWFGLGAHGKHSFLSSFTAALLLSSPITAILLAWLSYYLLFTFPSRSKKQIEDPVKLAELKLKRTARILLICTFLLVPFLGLLFLFLLLLSSIVPAGIIAVFIILQIRNNKTNFKILDCLDNWTPEDNFLLQKSRSLVVKLLILTLFFGGSLFIVGEPNPLAFLSILLFAYPLPWFIIQYNQVGLLEKYFTIGNTDQSGQPLTFPSGKNRGVPEGHNILIRPAQTLPLWETILKNDIELLQAELAKGTDVNTPYPANGNTPLHIAVWNGYMEQIKILLGHPNINKEAKNHAGKTPLDLAKEQGFIDIITLLGPEETQAPGNTLHD